MSYRIEAIRSSAEPAFAEAYAALSAEFAARGELERREVVERWLDEPPPAVSSGDLRRTYHLLVARSDDGALAGVRDCHVVIDNRARVVVAYLAHALVLPPHRRTGLGARLRGVPIDLAKQALQGVSGGAEGFEVLLAAEMEPATQGDTASIVRLTAYATDGFAAIAPAALPYYQPDFRDLAACQDAARPIPLLAVVRWVGHENASSMPRRLARAFVRHLYAVFATHVVPDHLADLEARTLDALDSSNDEVPLLPLPRSLHDDARILPLSREVVCR